MLATINQVFAAVATADHLSARPWYDRLFGRPPDMLPHAETAAWHLRDWRDPSRQRRRPRRQGTPSRFS
ncbi:MAG: hypothetical protein NVSMB2_24130 [Chloroflexota bacterium]